MANQNSNGLAINWKMTNWNTSTKIITFIIILTIVLSIITGIIIIVLVVASKTNVTTSDSSLNSNILAQHEVFDGKEPYLVNYGHKNSFLNKRDAYGACNDLGGELATSEIISQIDVSEMNVFNSSQEPIPFWNEMGLSIYDSQNNAFIVNDKKMFFPGHALCYGKKPLYQHQTFGILPYNLSQWSFYQQ